MSVVSKLGLAGLLLGTTPLVRADVTVVENGTAKTAIYVAPAVMEADKGTTYTAPYPQYQRERERIKLRESVKDFADILGRVSGTTIAVRTGAPAAGSAETPILIGELATQAFGAPQKKSPYRQGYRIVVGKKGIGLAGESDEATSYALYELLDQLGCRWYLPGDLGEVLPSLKTITLKDRDVSALPGTISRGIWYADDPFKRRSRTGGFSLSAGHALEISDYITKQELTDHPDWNAELNGKRSINGRFCWGNPEVAPAVARGIIRQLDKNYAESVSIAPEDGAAFCECPKCKALDAGDWDPSMNQVSSTDRFVHFCNAIATDVAKKYPDVKLGFLAYVQYTRPPVREKLHPSLVPLIAPITYCRAHSMVDPKCPSRQQMKPIAEGWGKASKLVAYYNYMFHLAETAVPYPMMKQMSDELPILYKSGVQLWNPETMPNFESVLPGMYLAIRMSLYPQAKPKEVLDEFFTRFYGNTAGPMRQYWQTIDDAWTNVPEHAGCGFSFGRRFTPAVMKAARAALDTAAAAAKTPMEQRRVKLQDDSFKQFELFMQLRWDLFDGKLAGLEPGAKKYLDAEVSLSEQYAGNYCFTKVGWTPYTINGAYFRAFYNGAYTDAGRISANFNVVPRSLRNWRYLVDKEKKGEAAGWFKADFDDSAWKRTDPCIDTWFALGLDGYYGPMWYRDTVTVPAVPAGKKTFLWVSSTDGAAKVFINGQHVPYVNEKGEKVPEFNGYCGAAAWDITSAVKPGQDNHVTILATRNFLNELGTGGLLGPVMLYQER